MDIAKIDTVLQGTTVVVTVAVTATTEATARGTRVRGNEVVVVDDEVVTEMAIDIAAVEEGTTMIRVVEPQGMTMTVDETTAAVMMILERLVEVEEMMDHHAATVVAAEERAGMVWVRLNEGPQRLKARYR